MKKIVILLCILILIFISVPYFTVRDLDSIIDKEISLESFDELYIEKENIYYPAKKVIIKNDSEIKEALKYFKSFRYYLTSQKDFEVEEEPFTFIFKNQDNSFYIEVFIYNKKSISVRTKNVCEEYNIKGKREFDFEYFKEILSRGKEIS